MAWNLAMLWKCLKLVSRMALLRLKSPSRYSGQQEWPQELVEPIKNLRSIIARPKTRQQEMAIAELLYDATVKMISRPEEHAKRQNKAEAVLEVSVPKTAEMILWFLTPHAIREALLGDLEEEHKKCAKKYGLDIANRDYWWQVVKTCASFLFSFVQRVAAVEYILRKLGL